MWKQGWLGTKKEEVLSADLEEWKEEMKGWQREERQKKKKEDPYQAWLAKQEEKRTEKALFEAKLKKELLIKEQPKWNDEGFQSAKASSPKFAEIVAEQERMRQSKNELAKSGRKKSAHEDVVRRKEAAKAAEGSEAKSM